LTYKLNCILVVDEAYFHFCKITAKNLIKKFNNLIIVRTFSKAFGLAGLRVGYCISNKKIIDLLKTIKPNYELNNINIKICKFLLLKKNIMKNYVKEINISNKLLVINLKKNGYEAYSSNSNSILINLKSKKECDIKYNKLIKYKILVKKLSFDNKNFCIRITSGSKKQIKKVIKIFEKK
jgi:histidinol-phosphate aminotransferase